MAEPQLRQLDAELARTPSGPASFRETLRFERALFLNVLHRVGDNLDALPPVVAPEPITGLRRYLFRKWPSANRLAICEDVQVHFLGPGGNYEDYLRCEEAIADRLDDWFADFKAFVGHAMLGAFRTFGFSLAPQIFHTEANLRHSRLAIAIERFRLAHGAPPPSLSALVPAFLPALPVSAYDGSAIRYQLRRDGTWKLTQPIPGSTPPSATEWPLLP